MKPTTIALAALAAGALLFATRANAAAPASAAAQQRQRRPLVPQGGIDRTQTYVNPQALRELQLMDTVRQMFGIVAEVPRLVAASPRASVDTTAARDAARRAEGVDYYGWAGPVVTAVEPAGAAMYAGDPYHSGYVDSIPAGPVYDVGQDTDPNAWARDPAYWGLGE